MDTRQDTFLEDAPDRGIRCSCCGTLFTKAELIEDPGLWHVDACWQITCDACDEGRRNWPHELREAENDRQR